MRERAGAGQGQQQQRYCVAAIADCRAGAVAGDVAGAGAGAGAGRKATAPADWSLNWLTSFMARLAVLPCRLRRHIPCPAPGMTHTNEKLLIMTLKRLACHEVRINLAVLWNALGMSGKGGRERAAGSWKLEAVAGSRHLSIVSGNRQLASAAVRDITNRAQDAASACLHDRLNSNDMPKALRCLACDTLYCWGMREL